MHTIEEIDTLESKTKRKEIGEFEREAREKLAEIEKINKFLYSDRSLMEKLILSLHLDIPSKEQLIKRRMKLFEELNELTEKYELYFLEEETFMGKQEQKNEIEFTPIVNGRIKK